MPWKKNVGQTHAFFRQLKDAGRAAAPGPLQVSFLTAFLLISLFRPIALHSSPTPLPISGWDDDKISAAFARYVRATDSRNNFELQRGTNLLWVDSLPDSARKKAYADLSRGEIQLEQRTSRESGREIACPDCMIHHWEGLVFIPGARLDDVLRVLEDYNHHAEYYAPDVVRSQIEAHDGDHFRVLLRFGRTRAQPQQRHARGGSGKSGQGNGAGKTARGRQRLFVEHGNLVAHGGKG